MKLYIETYGSYLVQGDARKMPFDSGSVGILLSHKLLNNFKDLTSALDVVSESVRVLHRGGQARLSGFNPEFRAPVSKFLDQQKVKYRFEGQLLIFDR